MAGEAAPENDLETLNQRFGRLYAQGHFEETVPLLNRILELQKKRNRIKHPVTAAAYNNLAVVQRQLGDYVAAQAAAAQALEIYRRIQNTNDALFATVLLNVGGVYQMVENYPKAEELYLQALDILNLPPATNVTGIAGAKVNLGGLCVAQGDYDRAERMLVEALKMYDAAGLSNHSSAATCLNNLGNFYQRLGDYENAEQAYRRSLRIREQASGAESRENAASLANLASVYWARQENEKAEENFIRAWHMLERTFGTNHTQTAACVQNLAVLYRGMNRFAEAEALYNDALNNTRNTAGTNNHHYASGLNNLAVLYRNMGLYPKALEFCQRALAILGGSNELDTPRAIRVLKTLAYLQADLGDRAAAVEAWRRCRAAEEKQTTRILSFTSEPQRLQFQRSHHFSELIEHIGSAPDAAEVVLRNKAIVLDSLIEDQWLARQSEDLEVKRLIDQLKILRRRLDRADEKRTDGAAGQAAASTIGAELERLQKDLARRVNGSGRARRAATVTVPQVQAAIPRDAVLLEWVLYRHYLRSGSWESRYGVVVIPPPTMALHGHGRGQPAWIPVGSATEIDAKLRRHQAVLRGAGQGGLFRELYNQLFEPIAKLLPAKTGTVIVCPDGELNFLSFAALLEADGRFLGQRYLVEYVSSGRDLVWEHPSSASRKRICVFADPDFNAAVELAKTGTPHQVLSSWNARDYSGLSLLALPGARKEGEFLKSKAESWRMDFEMYPGLDATEAELRTTRAPYILHLGTHGFILPVPGRSAGSGQQPADLMYNPMNRSGLALAGAQRTFGAWLRGERPPFGNDGVLTAQEVGALDLHGTWLAVLSACDSGGGEARVGEGVLGLRRGFMIAGAQNLLMTLAPISDQAAVGILKDFYIRALNNHDAPRALAEVQRDWLMRIRKEKGVLEAARTAGPFVLTFQGKAR